MGSGRMVHFGGTSCALAAVALAFLVHGGLLRVLPARLTRRASPRLPLPNELSQLFSERVGCEEHGDLFVAYLLGGSTTGEMLLMTCLPSCC